MVRRNPNNPPISPGRPKGIPNKFTMEIKDMVRGALDKAGGQDYLVAQSQKNPTAFMALVSKIIPSDVNAKLSGQVNVTIKQFSPLK